MITLRTLLLTAALGCVVACAPGGNPTGEWRHGDEFEEQVTEGLPALTIVDIDPDAPTRRMRKMRPLADHIADGLGWQSSQVQVVIARTPHDVAAMMQAGDADLFIDSGSWCVHW